MRKGFTLIEIMLAVALAAVILPALISVLGFSLQTAKQSESYTKAYGLAQEQMEAVYSIKERGDTDWQWTSTSPENTASGEYYQPQMASGVWELGSKTTTPSVVDGYLKTVEVMQYPSDLTHNETNSRLVNVYVTWKENGKDTHVNLKSLVTRY